MAFSTILSLPKLPKPSLLLPKSSSSPSPSSITFDLRSYWTSLIAEVEAELDSALKVKYPEKMYEAMRYSVFSGGKRAPPIMCIASCELFDAPRSAALPTAAALEMIHAASHVHDDLPCMDAAPLRRGRPTTHANYGVDVAVLVGDSLFPLGFTHVVSNTPSDLVPREALLLVLKEIAKTVGSTGMAAGQYLDLAGAAAGGEKEVLLVLEKKFGEMAECSAVCGAMLGGASEEEQASLRRYGRTVGVLYELVDDVLMESNGRSGQMRSNASTVRTLGIERALEIVDKLRDQAKKELEWFGEKYGDRVLPLMSFVDYAVERGFVVERGDEMVAKAAVS
ncbi:hypothetical protein LUZ60_016739 [Juncus effusus]|nr:hypothetical protein LUZ60_016739 [Juncus effusus]